MEMEKGDKDKPITIWHTIIYWLLNCGIVFFGVLFIYSGWVSDSVEIFMIGLISLALVTCLIINAILLRKENGNGKKS